MKGENWTHTCIFNLNIYTFIHKCDSWIHIELLIWVYYSIVLIICDQDKQFQYYHSSESSPYLLFTSHKKWKCNPNIQRYMKFVKFHLLISLAWFVWMCCYHTSRLVNPERKTINNSITSTNVQTFSFFFLWNISGKTYRMHYCFHNLGWAALLPLLIAVIGLYQHLDYMTTYNLWSYLGYIFKRKFKNLPVFMKWSQIPLR